MAIRKHIYTEGRITAVHQEGNYLWIAYKNVSSCRLKKVSAFNPSTVYFNITVEVDEILRIKSTGSYVYIAVDDDTYIGIRYLKTSPLDNYTFLTKPVGIEERSVDIALDSDNDYLFLLIPGEESGTVAKILKYTSYTTYDSTITLTGITYARTMDIDGNGEIWVATYTSPVKLIRVYEESAGYMLAIWSIQ